MATTATTATTNYLAAEYLTQRIGDEAAAAVVIAPNVWREELVGKETMTAHFRALEPFTMSGATEASALPTVTWSPDGVTVTAALNGFGVVVSKALGSIAPDVLDRIAEQGGTAAGRCVDKSLATLFPTVTSTAGSTGTALTVTTVFAAEAKLDALFAIGKKVGFVSPHQFANLRASVLTASFGIAKLNVDAMGNESITAGGATIYQTGLVGKANSNADFCGAIITEECLGLAIAQQPRVEVLDYPGYASWIVEASVAFGTGVIRPDFGCSLISGVNA